MTPRREQLSKLSIPRKYPDHFSQADFRLPILKRNLTRIVDVDEFVAETYFSGSCKNRYISQPEAGRGSL